MNKATRILVVDDDPAIRQIYPEFLRAGGYEVEEASTGQQGLQATRERPPDLVLLDVVLPDIGGIEVCRQIKADPALADVFVVLFSGSAAGAAEKVEGLETGADDYLTKSLDTREFLARIRTVLRLRDTTAALRASEKRFRQLAENIREVFWMTDFSKNEMVYISPGYEEIWGRTCESLYASPRNWMEAIHPDDRERVLDAALTKQVSGRYDEIYRILRPDGSERWIQDRAFPIRDESGKVYRIVGIAEDVTDRKEWEEALRASEARKGAVMEAALDAIVTIDHEGRIVEFNSAAEKTFGCTRLQAIGKEMAGVLLLPSMREWFRHGLAHLFGADKGPILGSRIEMAARRADGTEFPIEFTIGRIELPGPPKFTAFIRDISGRKRAEGQLTMLAHAVESTTEPITITDLQNRFTFVNRAFQNTYGFTEREILGKTPEILFSPRNPPSLMAEILEQTRLGGWRGEVLDRRKDGTEFPIFLSTSKITDPLGQVIGLIGVAQDITERQRAEERIRLLADAVQSTQELISVTDHENRLTFVNRAFLKQYGYSEKEVLGKKPDFLYSRKNAPGLCERVFQSSLAGGWAGEIINCKKDGTEFPISLQTSQIKNSRGEVIGLVGTARDISERKRAEQQRSAFSALGHLLSAANAPEQAASIILRIASELFGWDAGYVHLYSPAEDKILPVLTMDTIDGKRKPVPETSFTLTPSPLMREVMEQGPRLIDRSEALEAAKELVPFGDTQRPSACMMYVPIQSGGSVLGILSIQSYTFRAYSKKDLALLHALANSCGGALHRIKMTEALREAEAKYRGIFENATEGIFQTTAYGRYLHANPALARMFGYESPAELISSVANIAQQTFVSSETAEELKRLLATQDRALGFEAERLRKDGTRYWTNINVRAVRDIDGSLLHYEGTVQDITARKRSEEQLRTLSRAVEQSPASVVITDPQGDIEHVNAKFTEITGYTLDEVRGKNPRLLKSGIAPPEEYTQLWQRITSGHEWRGEFHNRKKNGELYWEAASISPILNEVGRVTHFVAVKEDITERKRAEKHLTAFAELGRHLSATATPQQAARIILEVASELFGWDAGYVHLYLQAEDRIIRVLTMDTVGGQRVPTPPARPTADPSPMMRRVMKEGPRLINRREGSDGGIELLPFGDLNRRAASMMYVPIRSGVSVVGILSIQSYTALAYSEADLRLLQGLADHCGDALERIRVAEALREAEAKYRSIFEHATEGIFQTTPTGKFLSANPALARMLGYATPEELIAGVSDIERQTYVLPGRREELKQLLERHGSIREFVAERRRRDGSRFWMSINLRLVRDSAGEVLYYEGTNQDITERKIAEQRLADAMELNLTILSTASVGILAFRASGQCIFANSTAARILGSNSPEQLLQLNFHTLASWKKYGLLEMAEETLRKGKLQSAEVHVLTSFARDVWLDCRMAPFVSGGEKHLLVVSDEITPRKRAEALLEESRRLQRAVLDNISDPAWLKDSEGRFLACNQALAKFYGRPPEEVVGRTAFDFDRATAERLSRDDQRAMQSRDGIFIEELLTDRQGKEIWFETIKAPIFDEAGRVAGTVGIAHDVTLRKQAEAELRQLSQRIIEAQEGERKRVARELHDGVNQVIASAKMRLRSLEARVPLKPVAKELVARCDELLARALDENRRLAHNLHPADLDELGLTEACRNLCLQLRARAHLVVKTRFTRIDRRYPPAVELHLFRIAQEALHNVEKHAHAKTVRLQIAFQRDHLILKVEDDGRGFGPKARQPGLGKREGLGLRNIRERAAILKGTCEVVSKPKQGTAITVRVPCPPA